MVCSCLGRDFNTVSSLTIFPSSPINNLSIILYGSPSNAPPPSAQPVVMTLESPIAPYRGLPPAVSGTSQDRRMASARRTLPQHQPHNIGHTRISTGDKSTNSTVTTKNPRRPGQSHPYPVASNSQHGNGVMTAQRTKFTIAEVPYVVSRFGSTIGIQNID
jgi:hypothetical protein